MATPRPVAEVCTQNGEMLLTSLGREMGPRADALDGIGNGVLRVAPSQPRAHVDDRLVSSLPQGFGITCPGAGRCKVDP